MELKLSWPELVLNKCQMLLCGNSYTSVVPMCHQNKTDESKNINYAFYSRDETVKKQTDTQAWI